MSKTTICEGEIVLSSAKNTTLHAYEGDISTSAEEKNEWKGESETIISDYEEMVIGEQNQNFIATIDFYRSQKNAEGKFGKQDSDYNGEFGFDRFDKSVCAEGLSTHYVKIYSIVPEKKTYKDRKVYLCPYLSLWPPGVIGNDNNSKSKVKLFVKANRASVNGTSSEAEVEFISSSELIKVTYSENFSLKIGDRTAKEVNIECLGLLNEDATIIAKAKNEPQVLGQLIVKSNTIFKTIIQPVKVVFANSVSLRNIDHEAISIDVKNTFNNNSFNQAFIYGELAPQTYQLTIIKSEVSGFLSNIEGKRMFNNPRKHIDYNEMIEEELAFYSRNTDRENSFIDPIRELLVKFKEMFQYESTSLSRVKVMHQEKRVTNIWKSEEIKNLYKNVVERNNKLDKKNKIYIFYTNYIEGSGDSLETMVGAFSYVGGGTVQIFNTILRDADRSKLIIHEIGHAFGLRHPFSSEMKQSEDKDIGVMYKQDYDNEIRKLERLIEDKNQSLNFLEATGNMTDSEGVPLCEVDALKEISDSYKRLNEFLDNRNVSFSDFERRFVNYLMPRLLELEGKELSKFDCAIYNQEDLRKELEIDKERLIVLEALRNNAKVDESGLNLTNIKDQSSTLENYLDYRQGANSPNINASFRYKSFYQWQCKSIVELGIQREYLHKM